METGWTGGWSGIHILRGRAGRWIPQNLDRQPGEPGTWHPFGDNAATLRIRPWPPSTRARAPSTRRLVQACRSILNGPRYVKGAAAIRSARQTWASLRLPKPASIFDVMTSEHGAARPDAGMEAGARPQTSSKHLAW